MNVEPVQRVLNGLGAHYALIGAHAMAARGYPRFTVDIDLLTADARVLDTDTWATLAQNGAEIEARRGDAEAIGGRPIRVPRVSDLILLKLAAGGHLDVHAADR